MADTPFNAFTLVSSIQAADLFLALRGAGGVNFTAANLADFIGRNAANGNAALPGMAFANDPDTGIFRESANVIGFATAGVERVRIASGGNVGIGTTSPSGLLHVSGDDPTTSLLFRFENRAVGATSSAAIAVTSDNGSLILARNGSGRTVEGGGNAATLRNDVGDLRLQGSGGYNNAKGITIQASTGAVCMGVTAPDLSGARAVVADDATGRGLNFVTSSGNGCGVIGTTGASDATAGLVINAYRGGGSIRFALNGAERWSFSSSGHLFPVADNVYDVGGAANRIRQFYSGTSAIHTSDERSKQDIGAIPEEWLDAWGDVEWVRYKFNDAVEAKGDDARWHVGLIAQRVRDAFAEAGLDALAIGLLCYDEWEEQREPVFEEQVVDTETVVVGQEGTGVLGPNGAEIMRDVIEEREVLAQVQVSERVGPEAGDRWGLRYDECQAMEAAWQRRERDRQDAAIVEQASLIADLTARLEAFEAAA